MPGLGCLVVTGASRGLGRTMALDFARRGYTVFAGVRRAEDGRGLVAEGGGHVRPLALDITSEQSIATALAEIRGQLNGKDLRGLVNNAAIFHLGPFEQTSVAVVEALFRVNVIGLTAVTQAFLPLLRRAKGRIVNISSVNGRLSFPFPRSTRPRSSPSRRSVTPCGSNCRRGASRYRLWSPG